MEPTQRTIEVFYDVREQNLLEGLEDACTQASQTLRAQAAQQKPPAVLLTLDLVAYVHPKRWLDLKRLLKLPTNRTGPIILGFYDFEAEVKAWSNCPLELAFIDMPSTVPGLGPTTVPEGMFSVRLS
jgi:hypothetical protein